MIPGVPTLTTVTEHHAALASTRRRGPLIGPLVRSPQRAPRSEPLPAGARRRVRNALVDLWEYFLIPLGRWHRAELELETVRIVVRDLPQTFHGYRIAFLTDLHVSPIVPRWWLDRAVGQAMTLGADLIVLGGDFVDDDPHYVPDVVSILAPLRAPDGVFGVLGNHDHYVGAQHVREALRAAGVRELLNSNTTITRGDAALAVCGVGDLEMDAIDFAAAGAGLPDGVPRIVLSHDPDVFAYWPDQVRCDLMLCGHTHGGQAYLPFIGPPFVPSQFGFRYLEGWFREGAKQLYVSRGIGTSGVPFRWRCPPELTLIELVRAEKS